VQTAGLDALVGPPPRLTRTLCTYVLQVEQVRCRQQGPVLAVREDYFVIVNVGPISIRIMFPCQCWHAPENISDIGCASLHVQVLTWQCTVGIQLFVPLTVLGMIFREYLLMPILKRNTFSWACMFTRQIWRGTQTSISRYLVYRLVTLVKLTPKAAACSQLLECWSFT
jgi:hypothetical protein